MKKLVAVVLLAGCGSVQSTDIVPISTRLRDRRAVQIVVSSGEVNAVRAVDYFRSGLIAELAKREIFVTFVKTEDPGGAEVKMEVTLSGFRGVSQTERAIGGGLAGRAKLTAGVVLTDVKSGEDLGAFFVYGKTGINADAGTSHDVIDAVAVGVAEYIRLRLPTP